MKRTNRVLALTIVMALLMSMVMMVPVSAANPPPNAGPYTVTIKPSSNRISLVGKTYQAFKLYDLIVDVTGENYNYVINSAFAGFPLASIPNYTAAPYAVNYSGSTAAANRTLKECLEFFGGEYRTIPGELVDYSKELQALAQVLYAYATANSIVANATATGVVAGPSSQAVLNIAAKGYYIIYGVGLAASGGGPTPTPATVNVVAAIGLITVDGYNWVNGYGALDHLDKVASANRDIILKADAPTAEKQVENTSLSPTPVFEDWADVAIGDTVNFKVTSLVPEMIGYTSYVFTLHDKMTTGLTFNSASMVVKVDETGNTPPGTLRTLILGTDYTLNTSPVDGDTFDLVFDPVRFLNLTPGNPIIITYSAMLNANAVMDSEVGSNGNKAYIQYSNDPLTGGTGGKTPETETEVFTFDVELFKYTNNNSPTPSPIALAGAEFEIRKDNATTGDILKYILINAGDGTNPAVYRLAVPSELVVPTPAALRDKLLSPASGKIQVKGLNATTTYFVEEVTPPPGYNKLELPFSLKIVANDSGLSQVRIDGSTNTTIDKVWVENNSGSEFPETGGIGRTIFIITGSALMFGALVTLMVRRRVTAH